MTPGLRAAEHDEAGSEAPNSQWLKRRAFGYRKHRFQKNSWHYKIFAVDIEGNAEGGDVRTFAF
jgi:hypothetical protein